jgi:hypothetical protein
MNTIEKLGLLVFIIGAGVQLLGYSNTFVICMTILSASAFLFGDQIKVRR